MTSFRKREVRIIDEFGIPSTPIVISASAGSPPSGSVISASAGSLSVGGLRPLSVVSASAGLLNPRDVISASAGSSRSTPRHDRHGKFVSASAAQSSPIGSVVSASAAHAQVGMDFGAPGSAQSVLPGYFPVAAVPLVKGEAIETFSRNGFELPREMRLGVASASAAPAQSVQPASSPVAAFPLFKGEANARNSMDYVVGGGRANYAQTSYRRL